MSREKHHPLRPPARPLLFVLSGLSGAGKDVILNGLRESGFPIEFIVTNTTRARRPGEKDGEHYNFVSPEEFQAMRESDRLLECAQVYGHWYGVPRQAVQQALAGGKDAIVKIDVQGAATIKRKVPLAVLIFLAPPSLEDLAERLKARRTEAPADLELRLATAKGELDKLPLFDYMVINRRGEAERAVAEVKAIITAEKCRVSPREITL